MALEFGEKLRNIVRDNAQTMTMIAQARKFMRPDISDYAEDKKTMMAKRRFCHMIIDNNDIDFVFYSKILKFVKLIDTNCNIFSNRACTSIAWSNI